MYLLLTNSMGLSIYIQIKKIIDANMDYIAQICLL